MQMDPKIAMIIKIVLAVLTAISTGGLKVAGLVDGQTATTIVAVCGALVTVLGIVMSAYSSSAPGPMAPQDPPSVRAAAQATGTATSPVVK